MTSKGICWFLLDDMKIIGKKRKKEKKNRILMSNQVIPMSA